MIELMVQGLVFSEEVEIQISKVLELAIIPLSLGIH